MVQLAPSVVDHLTSKVSRHYKMPLVQDVCRGNLISSHPAQGLQVEVRFQNLFFDADLPEDGHATNVTSNFGRLSAGVPVQMTPQGLKPMQGAVISAGDTPVKRQAFHSGLTLDYICFIDMGLRLRMRSNPVISLHVPQHTGKYVAPQLHLAC